MISLGIKRIEMRQFAALGPVPLACDLSLRLDPLRTADNGPRNRGGVHAAAVVSGRVHAWRYQPRDHVPCARSARSGRVGPDLSGGNGQPGSEWTAAQRD